MYYKNLNIFIKYYFGKLFFIIDFDFANSWQGFKNSIKTPNIFSIKKYNLCITSEEKK